MTLVNTVGDLVACLSDFPRETPLTSHYDGSGRLCVTPSYIDGQDRILFIYPAASAWLKGNGEPLDNPALNIPRWLLGDPAHDEDPRWAYAELTREQAWNAWPCGSCGTRRDEHADQATPSAYPELDITDHAFVLQTTPVKVTKTPPAIAASERLMALAISPTYTAEVLGVTAAGDISAKSGADLEARIAHQVVSDEDQVVVVQLVKVVREPLVVRD